MTAAFEAGVARFKGEKAHGLHATKLKVRVDGRHFDLQSPNGSDARPIESSS